MASDFKMVAKKPRKMRKKKSINQLYENNLNSSSRLNAIKGVFFNPQFFSKWLQKSAQFQYDCSILVIINI